MDFKSNTHLSLFLRKEIIYSFMHLCHLLADISEACWRNRSFHFILEIQAKLVIPFCPCRAVYTGEFPTASGSSVVLLLSWISFNLAQMERGSWHDLVLVTQGSSRNPSFSNSCFILQTHSNQHEICTFPPSSLILEHSTKGIYSSKIIYIPTLQTEDWNVIFEVPGKTLPAAKPALQVLMERLCWHRPGLNTHGHLCYLHRALHHSEEELTHWD